MNLSHKLLLTFLVMFSTVSYGLESESSRIIVRANKINNKVSPYTTGACLEDVNHEVYGGIYSQMIFGESFEEPGPIIPIDGFIYEGPGYDTVNSIVQWQVNENVLLAPDSRGAKLIANDIVISSGQVDVQVRFDGKSGGVAGLIVAVADTGFGADNFNGYEISLDAERQEVLFGEHRHNWQMHRQVKCPVKESVWHNLSVKIEKGRYQVFVDGKKYIDFKDDTPLAGGMVGLRTFGRPAKFRNLQVHTPNGSLKLPFKYSKINTGDQVSKMWTAVRRGSVSGRFSLEMKNTYNGSQSQRITKESGDGSIGIANSGLNHRGMCFMPAKEYEGMIIARSDKPVALTLTLESNNGDKSYGKTSVKVTDSDWQKLEFKLDSKGQDACGRFVIALEDAGSVDIGYCFLQPGQWGLFKGQPVRADVAQGLIDQGITILRYGGCMANAAEYRWKKMVGPHYQRPPYRGWWYSYSSNGWGIIDFMNFCEAAGFEYVPDFNIEETGDDMADFIEYAKGDVSTEWGAKRAADGHPEPYDLKYLQFGNEETVGDHYLERFKEVSKAIWEADPDVILIVGDFAYNEHITDPYNFGGAPRITSLAAHREILKLAKAANRPIWFDVHIWNGHPRQPDTLENGLGFKSYIKQLEKIANGAEFKVCIFEENANNHRLSRGLGHAHAINEIQRLEHEMPILCSANCLQPDGNNDNGWDQGLLFLDQCKVWGQSSYYVTQMISESYQPYCIESYVDSYMNSLDVTACINKDGKQLSLRVVNLDRWDIETKIDFMSYQPSGRAEIVQIKGKLNDRNTAENSDNIVPVKSALAIENGSEALSYTFPAHSYTIINLTK